MQTNTNIRSLRRLLFASAGLMMTSQIHAATITWGAAQDTSGPSDIVAGGAVVEALNGYPQPLYGQVNPARNMTLNGIDFLAINFLAKQFAGEALDSGLNGKTTGDVSYDQLIGNVSVVDAALGNGSTNTNGNYEILNLAPSTEYFIQIWYTDLRGVNDGRHMILDGQTTIQSGTEAGPGLGQYAIGTFTADDSAQLVNINANGSAGRAQISGLLVRAVPEPASSALIGCGGLALLLRRRR